MSDKKIDAASETLKRVEASLASILALPVLAAFPFDTVLILLRDWKQGNFYLAQITGTAAANLQRQFDLVGLRIQGLGATSLREYLFDRWKTIENTGVAGSTFSRDEWGQQVKELNEHQEVLDSDFVNDADRAALLVDWGTAFGVIESVWKDKVIV